MLLLEFNNVSRTSVKSEYVVNRSHTEYIPVRVLNVQLSDLN